MTTTRNVGVAGTWGVADTTTWIVVFTYTRNVGVADAGNIIIAGAIVSIADARDFIVARAVICMAAAGTVRVTWTGTHVVACAGAVRVARAGMWLG